MAKSILVARPLGLALGSLLANRERLIDRYLSKAISGMLKTVSKLFHPGRKTSLPYLAGVLFCGLLLAFAVTSKVAAYYPHDAGARPITATKMWQQQDPVTKHVFPAVQTAPMLFVFVFTVAVLAAIVRFTAWMQTATVFSPAFELCYRRTHAIRPPPRS